MTGVVVRHLPHLPGAVAAVGGPTASGIEVAGTVGGLVGAAVGLVGLFITIAAMTSKRRREYQQEIREAEERGVHQARAALDPVIQSLQRDMNAVIGDRDFYRNLAWGQHSGPLPIPPSQQPPISGGDPA